MKIIYKQMHQLTLEILVAHLFDMNGDVIGINTAILGRSGSIGIGFAIPSNSAKIVIDQLIEFGETKRGWLGVRIQDVTKEIAEVEKLDEPRGALSC